MLQIEKSHAIVAGVVTFLAIHDIGTQIKAKKLAKLFLKDTEAYEKESEAKDHQIDYLCHLLTKHNIEPTEFDLIALTYDYQ